MGTGVWGGKGGEGSEIKGMSAYPDQVEFC